MSFLMYEAKHRIKKENKLMKLDVIIDWEKIGGKLKGIYAYEVNGKGGQKPYDSLKMFKAILLGQWYSLSDPELEEALSVRLDFMLFTGLEGEVPDETTLCRFRNRLIERGLDIELFEEVNRELEEKGLKVKECSGAVIDATIIESASRPKKTVEIMATDRKEDKTETEEEKVPNIRYSKDTDARWLKKGKKNYFGYKGFVATSEEEGYIEKIHITPANRSEAKELESSIPEKKPRRVYADKGYASKDNRRMLKGKGIKDGIMEKAARNNHLGYWQRQKNRIISAKRFIVEQAFGTLKRRFKFTRSAYLGIRKTEGQLIIKAICYNLLKAVNKVEIMAVW